MSAVFATGTDGETRLDCTTPAIKAKITAISLTYNIALPNSLTIHHLPLELRQDAIETENVTSPAGMDHAILSVDIGKSFEYPTGVHGHAVDITGATAAGAC